MGPKNKFSKEDIIQAAFEIAKDRGFSGVTVRSVVKRLGCSVAPIYVNFETIDDLIKAVVERVFALSQELLSQQQGPDVFANIGRASLAFARDYPVFYRELILTPNPYMASYESVESSMLEAMGTDPEMQNCSLEQRRRLFLKMRAFQLGLTTLVANGHIPAWLDEQGMEELLLEVGTDLMRVENIKGEEK